jgi:hypothetical protein
MDMNRAYTFYETPAFARDWSQVARHEDLLRLQTELIANPFIGDVVKDTGGLRKMRFAKKGIGKSGGERVLYYFFGSYGVVLLALSYSKTEIANLNDDQKKALTKLAEDFEALLKRQTKRRKTK